MSLTLEERFTRIYEKNGWGSTESRSGPASTPLRTLVLRSQLPALFQTLQITTLLDVGCGEFRWLKMIDLSKMRIRAVDIVEPLIFRLQTSSTTDNIRFVHMNVLKDPPFTADLWLVRDFCGLYGYRDNRQLLKKFIESESLYIALTNVEADLNQMEVEPGQWVPINLSLPPYSFPAPLHILEDGEQWFRKKTLQVYSREQIAAWMALTNSIPVVQSLEEESDKPDRNAHLKSNVPLRSAQLYAHKE